MAAYVMGDILPARSPSRSRQQGRKGPVDGPIASPGPGFQWQRRGASVAPVPSRMRMTGPSALFSALRRSSLRSQLFALALAGTLPIVGLLAWYIQDESAEARDDARELLMHIARGEAMRAEQLLHDRAEPLRRFARLPQVAALDARSCEPLGPALGRLFRDFGGLRVDGPDGIARCGPVVADPAAPAGRLDAATRALAGEALAVGDALRVPGTERLLVPIAVPIPGRDGRPVGALSTLLDAREFARTLPDTAPGGARTQLRDGDGLRLAGEGAPRIDGRRVPVLQGEAPVPGTHWWAVVTMPEAEATAHAKDALVRAVLAGIVAFVIAAGLALGLAAGIARPIRRLAATATRIASGEQSARAAADGPAEVAEVALRLNGMLDALQRQREEKRALHAHYGALVDKARDIVLLMSEEGRIVDANAAAAQAYGYGIEELLELSIRDLRAPDSIAFFHGQWAASVAADGVLFETVHRRKDGSLLPVEVSSSSLEVDGKPYRQSHIRDITARKEAEARLSRVNRALRTASACNAALTRATDEARLLEEVTRRVVEVGGYRMAFVGYATPAPECAVAPQAVAGHDDGFLAGFPIRWDDTPEGNGPSGLAIRTGSAVACRDIASDERAAPWREACLARGYGAVIALPLRDGDGECLGVLTICSADAGAFDEEESGQLAELAGNLALGIRALRDRRCLDLQARRAAALLELPEAAERMEEKEFLQHGLAVAEELTGSRIAFIHLVHGDQRTIELVTWSAATLAGYCHAAHDRHYPVDQAGVWADALRRREPVVVNDYGALKGKRGLPAGHAALDRFVSVPVIEGSLVRMMAGIGNKPEDYTALDVETVKLIANALWRIVSQRRAEQELVKLSLAVEQSPDGVLIAGVDGHIEYANPAHSRITGYPPSELLGRNPRLMQSGRTPREVYDDLWRTLRQGLPWRGLLQNRRKDGTEYAAETQIAPLRQSGGEVTHYVAVQADASERLRTAEELERHRHRLEELVAERTIQLEDARLRAESASQAKSAFLANMSHEIRTPMNAIVGLAYLLRQDSPSPRQEARLAQVDSSARHLLSLVNDMLDLAAIEAGRLVLDEKDFELGALLAQVRSMVATPAEAKGLTLALDGPPQPLWLHGDATRVRQALLNYAGNAVKFTASGTVSIGARIESGDPQGLLIRFEVRDTGPGIDPSMRPRLFSPFEQGDLPLDQRRGGTGLGLAITRRLARAMGGEAGVESEPGHGSRFWFTVRLARGVAPVAPRPDTEIDAAGRLKRDHAGATVLVAEDNEINLEVARELLRAAGLRVLAAADGEQALALVARGGIDLVLMDIQMPRLDGLAATRRLRTDPSNARLPVVALSANAFPEDLASCREAGMDDVVAKPVDVPTLYRVILRLLDAASPAVPVASSPSSPPEEASTAPAAPAPAAPSWVPLPGVDGAALLARLKDGELARRLLGSFATAHAGDAKDVGAMLADGRTDEARRRLHSLKGVAANLAVGAVATQAGRLEEALRSGRSPTDFPASLEEIDRAIRTLREAIAGLDPAGTPPAVGDANRDGVLDELASLLSTCDVRATGFAIEHAPALAECLGPASCAVTDLAAAFRFEEALAALRAARSARGTP
jgi:PAS domain S-box-containing protein